MKKHGEKKTNDNIFATKSRGTKQTNKKKEEERKYLMVRMYYLDIAEPIGKVIELFAFALTLTITEPSTNGANPGKNLFK